MSPNYLAIYDSYRECNSLLNKLISFIKDKSNPLQERFNMFRQCVHMLPYGNYLSEWCITNRSHAAFDHSWNDRSWLRGAITAEDVIEQMLEHLYEDLPDSIYEMYQDDVPLDILFAEASSDKKDFYKLQIEAILTDCKAGVFLDW